MAKAFMETLTRELVDRRPGKTRPHARSAIGEYIEGWYKPRRRHSSRGDLGPAQFEAAYRSRSVL